MARSFKLEAWRDRTQVRQVFAAGFGIFSRRFWPARLACPSIPGCTAGCCNTTAVRQQHSILQHTHPPRAPLNEKVHGGRAGWSSSATTNNFVVHNAVHVSSGPIKRKEIVYCPWPCWAPDLAHAAFAQLGSNALAHDVLSVSLLSSVRFVRARDDMLFWT
jgi:hypothetical protein